MSKKLYEDLGLVEGRTYIIGREGHIFVDSPEVSKHHASLTINDGQVYLKDLNSTNGTYLVKNSTLVYFEEGFVHPLQPIAIGETVRTVQSLLEIAASNSPARYPSPGFEDTRRLNQPLDEVG